MAMALSHLPPWLWRKGREQPSSGSRDDSALQSRPTAAAAAAPAARRRRRSGTVPPPRRRGRRQQLDAEFDVVVVPPDGCCMSGSESDESDWSVGWLEPHAADFYTGAGSDEDESSFAVLVPCYAGRPRSSRLVLDRRQRRSPSASDVEQEESGELQGDAVWGTLLARLSRRNAKDLTEDRKNVEKWLSSIQQ